MNVFSGLFTQYNWEEITERINGVTVSEVDKTLAKSRKKIDDFLNMISPAASFRLERMAVESRLITQKRFGKTIQLYMPLYLSNECQNICTYCGFSMDNKIPRKTLSDKELLAEAQILKSKGIEHVLLVSGEANKTVGLGYFLNAIRLLKPLFANISLEVQPLSEAEYQVLHNEGIFSILVYQETYHEEVYRKYHPKGRKSNFANRLETPEKIGSAGIHKIGLGVLLGLEDWRTDSFFTALHLAYLQKKFWKSRFSVSFPRLRPAEGFVEPNFVMRDPELLQLICAYRIWNPDLEISVSTRESEKFRNHIISLGATTMSAESKTNPGGYSSEPQSLEQFEICDQRSISEIKTQINKEGYDPVMKDWHNVFN